MRRIYEIFIGTAGNILPPTGCQFESRGSVSPEDFIKSGNSFIKTHNAWKWVADSSNLSVCYLPPDKQYLLASDITCIKIPEINAYNESGWNIYDYEGDSPKKEHPPCYASVSTPPDSEDLANLDDSEICDRLYRSYDVSITYDRYYETPRIWLFGYGQMGLPLTKDEMLTDVLPSYAGTSITVERHPYTGRLNLTVHPCYQTKAIACLSHDSKKYNVEDAIELSLQIWASVLPSFSLCDDQRTQQNHT